MTGFDMTQLSEEDRSLLLEFASRPWSANFHGRVPNKKDEQRATQKPHGRLAYTLIHAGHTGDIDLSVIGPLPARQPTEPSA